MSGEILNMGVSDVSILFDCLKFMVAESHLWDVGNDSAYVLIAQ